MSSGNTKKEMLEARRELRIHYSVESVPLQRATCGHLTVLMHTQSQLCFHCALMAKSQQLKSAPKKR